MTLRTSVGDPDHVFGWSGSVSQRYGSGTFPFPIKVLSGLTLQNKFFNTKNWSLKHKLNSEDNVPVGKLWEKDMKYFFLASFKSLKKEVGSVSQLYGSAPKCHRSPTLLGTLCKCVCIGREAAVAAAAEPGLAPGELLRNHGGQAVPARRLEDQVPFLHALVSFYFAVRF